MAKGDFTVHLHETNTDSLMAALGITEERCQDLCEMVKDMIVSNKNWGISDVIANASKYCQNPNELAFVGFIVGKHVGFGTGMEAGTVMSQMEDLLGGLFQKARTQKRSREAMFN